MSRCKRQKGTVLLICMIFVCVFSTFALSMATMCDTNGQLASNQHKAGRARSCAESGMEIIRRWFSDVSISGTTPESQRFNQIATSFQSYAGSISGISTSYDGSTVVAVPTVTLDSVAGESFLATVTKIDDETLQVAVTGVHGSITKTIRANYTYGYRASTVFDYGVATRGPLSLTGNILLDGVNISVESDVYIESENSNLALEIIGNSQIAGDVKVTNPIATVDLQGGQAGIGGETGQDAIDNHVEFGAPQTEFPEPNPTYFEPYVTNIIDSSSDTSSDAAYENVRIVAGTNPHFTGNVQLRGVIFIETPNIVNFSGNVDMTGIIVGDGDFEDDSGTNQINFTGNVSSLPVTELPGDSQFDGIRDETGTFLMAPGFSLSFGGNFSTLSGAIAGNGINFHGNAGGTINGSILNYSDVEMSLSGNSDLFFNRSGLTEVPAGFVPEIVLYYDPNTYAEGPF